MINITNNKYVDGPKGRKTEFTGTPLQAAKLLIKRGVKVADLYEEIDDHMLWLATAKLDIAAVDSEGCIYGAPLRRSRSLVASGYCRFDLD